MKVIKINELPYAQTGWGVKAKPIIDMPEIGIINLILEPGEQVPAHKTPVDVLFQVIEGKGEVIIGEEKQVVESGSIIVSPAQIPHALEANQGCIFSVLVMKVPNMKKNAVKE
jgi:quercetin dioxygenase-like cupin family protein